MTDADTLNSAYTVIDPTVGTVGLISRNRRTLLALPGNAEAAERALGLYQPQRPLARLTVTGLRLLIRLRLHAPVLRNMPVACGPTAGLPDWEGAEAGSCGILLGSPEHLVRRAIASYRHRGRWEVAKIAFGDTGARVLEREAEVLANLRTLVSAAPDLLGFHRGQGLSLLRMPYLTGAPIQPGHADDAVQLLSRWLGSAHPEPIRNFAEWTPIQSALLECVPDTRVLDLLSEEILRPGISHGDFARWNLMKRSDGSLMVLDWEWGQVRGMPGLDLVHYFLQDERLVKRLPARDAIRSVVRSMEIPCCREYLEKTGWSGNRLLPVIASLAHKQGAGHQDNREFLLAAIQLAADS